MAEKTVFISQKQSSVLEGETIKPGENLLELKACCHPTIMNDMCAECGIDLRKDDNKASVPIIHSIPDLKVSEEQAKKLGKAVSDRLINDRKLVLLVDLDQTLIHTMKDNIPSNRKDVYHFQLYGPNSQWFNTYLRPGTRKFLHNIHYYYELHICTFGSRNYAHTIASFLDPDQKLFSNRILSRDDCFDPTSKKANLKALFPCGDNMVCIIDDREDVWSHASNLIRVVPYHYYPEFEDDISDPPSPDKHEDDNKTGFELTNLKINANQSKDNAVNETIIIAKENEELPLVDSVGKKENEKKTEHLDKINGNRNKVVNEKIIIAKENGELLLVDNIGKIKNEKKSENLDKVEEQMDSDVKRKPDHTIKTEELQEKSDKNVNKSKSEVDTNTEVENSKDDVTTETAKVQDKDDENVNKCNPEMKKETDAEAGKTSATENNMIDECHPDYYLIYIEDVLKNIHKEFYDQYDKMESGEVPDLKKVIPFVRSKVLRGCKLVFTDMMPARAFQVAQFLGADVTQDFESDTTHLVVVNMGSTKVIAGRRRKNLKMVTLGWLWRCAINWKHMDESLFPLLSTHPDRLLTFPDLSRPAKRKCNSNENIWYFLRQDPYP